MNVKMKDFGFYRPFFIVAALAIIFLGGWNYVLKRQYRQALLAFQRSKADLAKAFAEIKQIRRLIVAKNEMDKRGEWLQPELYFQKQLSKAGIDFKSYHIKPPRERSLKIRSGKKRKNVIDREVEISFKIKGRKNIQFIPRSNWFVALYNCEAGSKRWRLRELSIRAKEEFSSNVKKGNYPRELSDEWFIEKLMFVSREPKQ